MAKQTQLVYEMDELTFERSLLSCDAVNFATE